MYYFYGGRRHCWAWAGGDCRGICYVVDVDVNGYVCRSMYAKVEGDHASHQSWDAGEHEGDGARDEEADDQHDDLSTNYADARGRAIHTQDQSNSLPWQARYFYVGSGRLYSSR